MRSCEVCSPPPGGTGVAVAAGIVVGGAGGVEALETGGEGLGAENTCRAERECWSPGDDAELRSGEVATWEAELMAAPRERAGDCCRCRCCCGGKRERRLAVRDGGDDGAIVVCFLLEGGDLYGLRVGYVVGAN